MKSVIEEAQKKEITPSLCVAKNSLRRRNDVPKKASLGLLSACFVVNRKLVPKLAICVMRLKPDGQDLGLDHESAAAVPQRPNNKEKPVGVDS